MKNYVGKSYTRLLCISRYTSTLNHLKSLKQNCITRNIKTIVMLIVAFKFFEVAVSQIQTEEFFFNDLGFSCNSDEFECDNGQCVASSLRCDGDLACTDNSDERDCACLSSELKCGNGNCVRVSNLCDGVQHCPDGSDEANCGREHHIYVMNSKREQERKTTSSSLSSNSLSFLFENGMSLLVFIANCFIALRDLKT